MNSNKIQYDPKTGGFIVIDGVSKKVKDSLKAAIQGGMTGGYSSSNPKNTSAGSYIKYGGSPIGTTTSAGTTKLEDGYWMKTTVSSSTLETHIHDTLMKILKGEIGERDYWKEDRETLIEYLSQVLYSIINPEVEEQVRESLVEKALQKLGGFDSVKKDLEEAKAEISEKTEKISSLEYQLMAANERLRRMEENLKSISDEIRYRTGRSHFSVDDEPDLGWDPSGFGDIY